LTTLLKNPPHPHLALDNLIAGGHVELKNQTVYITLDGLEWWDWHCFARYGVKYFSTRTVNVRSHWMPITIHVLPMKFTEAEFFGLFSRHERGRTALNTLMERDVLKYDPYHFLTFTTKWKERKKLMNCEYDCE